MKTGDKIRINWCDFGYSYYEDIQDYVVEEFRHTLGIFRTEEERQAGQFTPLCELYYRGPDSEDDYISNYGSYVTNKVQGSSDIP